MATKLVNLSSGNTQLVGGQSGKIIRLLRILLGPNADIQIRSDASAILPNLRCGANANVDRSFSNGSVQTASGEDLNAYNATVDSIVCWIEYDLVA